MRAKQGRWKWILGLILLLGLVVLVIWAARRPPAPKPTIPSPTAESQTKMESLALTEIQDGDKRWVLAAQKAEFLKDQNEIRISGVQVEFFEAKGEHIRVQCQEGLINTKTRFLTLKGEVALDYQDLHIRTDLVTYQPVGRVLLAPDEVTLESSRLKVEGKELRVELADRKLILAQHRLTEIKVQGWEVPHL
jgi:LPS export ABC transporter protein LptC